jgi:hypothetical protein
VGAVTDNLNQTEQSMSDLRVYGFEDASGEPDEFQTLDPQEAAKYARRHNLKMIEHVYEWTEQLPVKEHDYIDQGPPPNRLLRPIPPEGTKIRLSEAERFPHLRLDAGEIATVVTRDFEQGVAWVKLEKHHAELDEWKNEIMFSEEHLGDTWPNVTDKHDRLRMAFWSEVEEVLPEAEQT